MRVSDSLVIIKAMNRKDSLFPEEIKSLIASLQNQNPEILDRAASILQGYCGQPLLKLLSTIDHELVHYFIVTFSLSQGTPR